MAEAKSQSRKQDPWPSFNFRVEIDGVPFTGFCRVDGLESTIDVSEHDGAPAKGKPKRPRRRQVGSIVVQRAASAYRHLWDWHQAAVEGRDDRRAGKVSVLGEDGKVVMTIGFEGAWPCRWKLTTLDALRSGVLIEEIELAVEDLWVE
ncbi:MAG: phage tail protein [Acidimicrobiia bacterium]|nr:phage tail protein [Acidimicrobiia bacterium]